MGFFLLPSRVEVVISASGPLADLLKELATALADRVALAEAAKQLNESTAEQQQAVDENQPVRSASSQRGR